MLYKSFLSTIKNLIIEKWINISWEEYELFPIWSYVNNYFEEHKSAIEEIMKLWYEPDNCFLRETLSWEYPIIYLNDNDTFIKSYYSWKSDLIVSVTFSKENTTSTKNEIEYLVLRVEFWDTWIAWID